MPERRMLAADFLRAFGDETRRPPALTGIAVGADTDNAGGTTVGYLADLVVSRVPARTAERRE